MIDKLPPRDTALFALALMGFNELERVAIMQECNEMAARGEEIEPVAMVAWLIEIGAIVTLGLLTGRREVRPTKSDF